MKEIELFKQDFRLYNSAHQQHIKYAVNVPNTIESIRVVFTYGPQVETDKKALEWAFVKEGLAAELAEQEDGFRNLLTLTVNDGKAFRGAHHYFSTDQEVLIAPDQASLGFRPGPIQGGEWEFIISCHGIFSDFVEGSIQVLGRPSADFTYNKILPLSAVNHVRQNSKERPQSSLKAVFHKAELHTHTLHSDAGQSTESLLKQAADQAIEWLAITDHNTITGIDEAQAHDNYDFPGQIISGMEYTTFNGHMVVHGHYQDLIRDWTELNPHNVVEIMEDLQAHNLNVTVAHPFVDGNPYCTGCRWDYIFPDLHAVDTIEVWNGPNPHQADYNRQGFERWVDLLNLGYRVNASAGRDWHNPANPTDHLAYTYILAKPQADLDDILSALKLGRSYVSLRPLIKSFVVNQSYQLGDLVNLNKGQWKLDLIIENLEEGDTLKVMSNKGLVRDYQINRDQSLEISESIPDQDYTYLRLEVLNTRQERVLFTNPIYKGQVEN